MFWYIPSRLWGKWVKVGRWTRYGRKWLIRRFEEDFWPTEARGGAINRRVEIEGRDQDEDPWEAVSDWRRDQQRVALEVAAALRNEPGAAADWERGQPGRPAGFGVGVLVRHIRESEGVKDYNQVLGILRESGLHAVDRWLTDWGDEARKRLVGLFAENAANHANLCQYCKGQPMPDLLRAAIDRRKYPAK